MDIKLSVFQNFIIKNKKSRRVLCSDSSGTIERKLVLGKYSRERDGKSDKRERK